MPVWKLQGKKRADGHTLRAGPRRRRGQTGRQQSITGFGAVDLLRSLRPVFDEVSFMMVAVLVVHWLLAGTSSGWLRLSATIGVGATVYAGAPWFRAHGILDDLRGLLRELHGPAA
jgi:hypothetical protein